MTPTGIRFHVIRLGVTQWAMGRRADRLSRYWWIDAGWWRFCVIADR